jgi:hypothetical protein
VPYWLGPGLWLATVGTLAAFGLVCAVCGWVLGYGHRELVEWGRCHALRRLARAYRELIGDVERLGRTGRWT